MQDNTNEYITIPVVALELLKAWGFIKRYAELCQTSPTFAAAYEQTEEEYEMYFGMRRYADYYSFKTALHYHREQKQKQQRAERKKGDPDQVKLEFGE